MLVDFSVQLQQEGIKVKITTEVKLLEADPGGTIMSCTVFNEYGQEVSRVGLRLSSHKNIEASALELAAALLQATGYAASKFHIDRLLLKSSERRENDTRKKHES
jgi:hypothetical protein